MTRRILLLSVSAGAGHVRAADALQATVTSLDWGSLFDDDPPRAQRAWRRKHEDRDFLIPLEAGWKDGGLRLRCSSCSPSASRCRSWR